jgi:hypothetical protein
MQLTETTLAERLGAMGCQVELVLADAKVWVDYVYASGKITQDGMKTEPLSEEVFSCLNSLQRLRKLRLDVKGGNTDRLRFLRFVSCRIEPEMAVAGS